MSVFVLIPVFNRLEHTKKVLQSLRNQMLVDELNVIIINDGSTDGTGEFLSLQNDITTLDGDGTLWWGGAIEIGLEYIDSLSKPDDYVIFLNNDTWFEKDYIETLIRTSRENGNAAVGSVIYEENTSKSLVSIGPRVSVNRVDVWDKLSELSSAQKRNLERVYRVDALSGRGTLYPASLFKQYGRMRPLLLPHYLADYEVSMRFARKAQLPLLVSSEAVIYSIPVYGNDVVNFSMVEKWFGQRSSSNIIRKIMFYFLVGNPFQRITAPLRLAYFGVARLIRVK